jgi:ParB-like chromosome segregation protein Spo0J
MSASLLEAAPADLQQHPLSAAFPAMFDDDFKALKDSIESIGVQNPIVLFEGMVLDGWHRYRAAQESISQCPAVDLSDDVDPKDFVIAQNERRRHLSASQIAAAVVAVHAWYPSGANKATQSDTGKPSFHVGKTNEELADIAGVSIQTIKQAKVVQTQAAPEVQDAVKAGTVSIKDAAAVAKLPTEEQRAIASVGPLAIKKAATAQKRDKAEAVTTQPAGNTQESETDELRRLLAEKDEQIDTLAASLKEAIADNECMGKVFDADDRLAATTAEISRLNALVQVIESRFTAQTNELNEAKRLAQQWRRRAERAEAALPKEAA